MSRDLPAADYPPERAAQFETLAERTGPPTDVRCSCDRCVYSRHRRAEAA